MLPQIRERWYGLHRQQLQTQANASDLAAVLGGATKFVRVCLQSLCWDSAPCSSSRER